MSDLPETEENQNGVIVLKNGFLMLLTRRSKMTCNCPTCTNKAVTSDGYCIECVNC
jgi:queuine/archaeosine tRNA-ribosyltransferase